MIPFATAASGFFRNLDAGKWAEIGNATLDTLLMLGGALPLTLLIGLPLGVLLFLTGTRQTHQRPLLYGALALAINVLRSVPFIILMISMIPLTLWAMGTSLDVRVFNDYVQPNDQVVQKQIDLNYFQTEPYLDAYNRDRKSGLVSVIGVHIEPFGAYSRRFKSLAELPQGADVVIPNDPSNNSRALILLDKAGVIKLKDPGNALSTQRDIVANPKQMKFRELDSAMLPRVLEQVDLALINTNYALHAGLNPTRDALAIESKDSPYVNFLVARADNKDDPRVQKLVKALTSPEVKAFIERKYQGAVLPAF